MGLDMYLFARRYISEYNENEKKVLDKINPITKEILCGFPVRELVVEAMYWRKQNHIHKWFVDNVQNGKDDCGYYSVSHEDLRNLLDTINKVLKSRKLAEELLPTQSGFFSGGTKIDDYYFHGLTYTKNGIEKILSGMNEWDWIIQYHSSW